MDYIEAKPYIKLAPFIHSFWQLKGGESDRQWERNFPDGCAGLVMNLGDTCLTDNGEVALEFGKTYAVGAMSSFKDSFIHSDIRLIGVCLKPAAFASFFEYAAQNEIKNSTIEFERSSSFNLDQILADPAKYLNRFFTERLRFRDHQLQSVIEDIHAANGQTNVEQLSQRNFMTVRKMERNFRKYIGLSPKVYLNIIRFQHALRLIKNANGDQSLSDIAFECGYYDHAHLSNEIRRNTGLSPSQL